MAALARGPRAGDCEGIAGAVGQAGGWRRHAVAMAVAVVEAAPARWCLVLVARLCGTRVAVGAPVAALALTTPSITTALDPATTADLMAIAVVWCAPWESSLDPSKLNDLIIFDSLGVYGALGDILIICVKFALWETLFSRDITIFGSHFLTHVTNSIFSY